MTYFYTYVQPTPDRVPSPCVGRARMPEPAFVEQPPEPPVMTLHGFFPSWAQNEWAEGPAPRAPGGGGGRGGMGGENPGLLRTPRHHTAAGAVRIYHLAERAEARRSRRCRTLERQTVGEVYDSGTSAPPTSQVSWPGSKSRERSLIGARKRC